MNFASNEFFYHLKEEVLNENSDGKIYYELEEMVKKSVYGLICRKIPSDAVNDVYQEVFFNVWRKLTDYIIKSENMTEAQRMSWLLTITHRRIADFYEKKKYINGSENISIDDEDNHIIVIDNNDPYTLIDKEEFTSCMDELLTTLLDMDTAPEKIMGYIYSKLIFKNGKGVSGKPSVAVEYLSGKSLYVIFESMKKDLSYLLEIDIPERVFLKLKHKLDLLDATGNKVGERIFVYSVKKITDGNNRIQKKLENNESRERMRK